MREDIVEAGALEAIKENPQAVADYMAGKEKALNSLMGAVMKKTKGRAEVRTEKEMLLGRTRKNVFKVTNAICVW